jgi:hypothetical protein
MSTDDSNGSRPTAIYSVTLARGTPAASSSVASTVITHVSSTSAIATSLSGVRTAIVVRVGGDEAIRKANNALAGVELPAGVNTASSEKVE